MEVKNIQLLVYVTPKQDDQVRKLSYIRRVTRSLIVREALEYYFNRKETK